MCGFDITFMLYAGDGIRTNDHESSSLPTRPQLLLHFCVMDCMLLHDIRCYMMRIVVFFLNIRLKATSSYCRCLQIISSEQSETTKKEGKSFHLKTMRRKERRERKKVSFLRKRVKDMK